MLLKNANVLFLVVKSCQNLDISFTSYGNFLFLEHLKGENGLSLHRFALSLCHITWVGVQVEASS